MRFPFEVENPNATVADRMPESSLKERWRFRADGKEGSRRFEGNLGRSAAVGDDPDRMAIRVWRDDRPDKFVTGIVTGTRKLICNRQTLP